MSNDIVGNLRKNGYTVTVNHFRRVFSFANGYDCLQKHEMNTEDIKVGNMHVFNNGGFTRVDIVCPNGDVLTGKHNFSASKPFCRRIGVIAALGRAFGGTKEMARAAFPVTTRPIFA